MISKTYNPKAIEEKWYKYWIDNQFFKSTPDDREPYTIVIPPPNVTGVLHMGHMLNNTIQDILIRKARMEGKNACWVPGTDHASIATEAKVVAMLREKGINKNDLTRDEFLAYAWEWTHKYGGIILQQLRKLGASCDWDRTRFTMEPKLYESVIDVFVDLYKKGKIYRGVRMVNWDPQGKTAVSDEEVNMKEVQQRLVYIQYAISPAPGEDGAAASGESITIATTRPETIMADSAIAINPNDERYKHLQGRKAIIPLINREIPIITDEYVTMDFGTGCLKVTPAHDRNDYELGVKHRLPVIDILNDDGTLNEKAQILVGTDRFAARKAVIKLLEESGNLVKIEEYTANVGYSERTNAVIEPRLSLQWFLKMDELAKPALESVMNDIVQLNPARFKNMYRSWMEKPHDWCISRQLWWGQQIPAFYMNDGTIIVAKNKREALRIARDKYQLFALSEADLTQDEDVLDTWFSSWLWPMSVFDGLIDPNNADINYYYPTNTLVTGFDIIFFWVARMIVAGYEFKGEKPFKDVYFTGMVRDKQGRKMSKQLGNSPDPIELIEQFGADGVRTGMLFSAAAGNDLLFDEKLVEQGRNFCNKIWNAFRLVNGWQVIDGNDQNSAVAVRWFESKLNATLSELQDHFSKYRISDALQTVYKLIWDDFCSQYLEMIKPGFEQPIDRCTYEATLNLFEQLMKLAHPFMPFITEEIWHELRERAEGKSICISDFPKSGLIDNQLLRDIETALELITGIRNIRSSKQISPKTELPLTIKTLNPTLYKPLEGLIRKLANLSDIRYNDVKQATGIVSGISFIIKGDEFSVDIASEIDIEQERANQQKELIYIKGFRDSVLKKLSNEKFVANAKPEVIEREKQKLADAESKIQALEENVSLFKN